MTQTTFTTGLIFSTKTEPNILMPEELWNNSPLNTNSEEIKRHCANKINLQNRSVRDTYWVQYGCLEILSLRTLLGLYYKQSEKININLNLIRNINDVSYIKTLSEHVKIENEHTISIIQTGSSKVNTENYIKAEYESTQNTDIMVTQLNTLATLLTEDTKHRVYILVATRPDTPKKAIKIITNKTTYTLLRKTLTLLPTWFKEDFNEIDPTILEVYAKDNTENYDWFAKATEIVEQSNLLEKIKRAQLKETLNNFKKRQLYELERTINDTQRIINEASEKHRLYLQKLILNEATYETLKTSTQDDENTLLDYLETNKNIVNFGTEVRDRTVNLKIRAHTPIVYYEPQEVEMYFKPGRILDTTIYKKIIDHEHGRHAYIPALIYAIFIKQEYRLWVDQTFYIDTNRLTIRSNRSYSEHSTFMPNPHLYHYNCWGGNTTIIQTCLAQGDLIGAIEQSLASVKAINFTDSAVVRNFYEDLGLNNCVIHLLNNKMLEDVKTGEFISIANFIKIMEHEQNEEEKGENKDEDTALIG